MVHHLFALSDTAGTDIIYQRALEITPAELRQGYTFLKSQRGKFRCCPIGDDVFNTFIFKEI